MDIGCFIGTILRPLLKFLYGIHVRLDKLLTIAHIWAFGLEADRSRPPAQVSLNVNFGPL